MKKILVIRFSSIGDIVLTTPVLRCVKQQVPGVELHYVCKAQFADVLKHNPYIDKLHTFNKDINELYVSLQAEHFDYVVDLHKNLRSFRLKQKLGVKSTSFHKLNIEKFLAVQLKYLRYLPPLHIVERYLNAVKALGVNNDGKGLDYFIGDYEKVNVAGRYFEGEVTRYMVLVAGGSYYTKQIPFNKLREICAGASLPVIVLGGNKDEAIARKLCEEFPGVKNACGAFSINQSASLIEQADWVVTSDTGLMHIAAAFHKKIISLWGNTIPEFGMGVYLPHPKSHQIEVKGLSCRPCSKLGYKQCPKGHFKCMNDMDVSFVKELE